jgi:hypothetical protein
VGAVDAENTPGLGGTLQSENFSATGAGTQLWLITMARPFQVGPLVYNPVAISGIDDINTTVPGFDPFFGTSATAPSVAGVVADMLQANPNLTFARVKQILQQTALPFGDPLVAGAGLVDAATGTVGLNWQFSGIGNFSGRGTSDMLLRDADTGELQAYNINSNQITGSAFIGTVGLDWQFSGVGNFSSGPGESDLLLRNSSTGGLQVYNINNNQLTGTAFIGTVGVDWAFAGVAPVSAPGASDLVLRNDTTGQFQVYNIADNQITGSAPLGTVGTEWQLGGFAPGSPTGSMGSLDSSTSKLVQAMASLDGSSGAVNGLNIGAPSADTSQQTLLTTPQHA